MLLPGESTLCGPTGTHTHASTHKHKRTHTQTHLIAINTAAAILIFNCVDGLHLCCSVMQTLLYILSGLIVIRAENLIKPNNKGDHSFFFSSSSSSRTDGVFFFFSSPSPGFLTPYMLQLCSRSRCTASSYGSVSLRIDDI